MDIHEICNYVINYQFIFDWGQTSTENNYNDGRRFYHDHRFG